MGEDTETYLDISEALYIIAASLGIDSVPIEWIWDVMEAANYHYEGEGDISITGLVDILKFLTANKTGIKLGMKLQETIEQS